LIPFQSRWRGKKEGGREGVPLIGQLERKTFNWYTTKREERNSLCLQGKKGELKEVRGRKVSSRCGVVLEGVEKRGAFVNTDDGASSNSGGPRCARGIGTIGGGGREGLVGFPLADREKRGGRKKGGAVQSGGGYNRCCGPLCRRGKGPVTPRRGGRNEARTEGGNETKKGRCNYKERSPFKT